jgi:hypothetical protein
MDNCTSDDAKLEEAINAGAGLPDGIFSNQKSKFG